MQTPRASAQSALSVGQMRCDLGTNLWHRGGSRGAYAVQPWDICGANLGLTRGIVGSDGVLHMGASGADTEQIRTEVGAARTELCHIAHLAVIAATPIHHRALAPMGTDRYIGCVLWSVSKRRALSTMIVPCGRYIHRAPIAVFSLCAKKCAAYHTPGARWRAFLPLDICACPGVWS